MLGIVGVQKCVQVEDEIFVKGHLVGAHKVCQRIFCGCTQIKGHLVGEQSTRSYVSKNI